MTLVAPSAIIAHVADLIYEREFAREMLFSAIRHRAEGSRATGDVVALVDRAVDAGCGRTELIVELAELGALLFDTWTPELARDRLAFLDAHAP